MNLKSYSLVVLSLAATSLFGGCRRQAYTELYVEHMASEIRELEDRIYEYDAEYRALESELIYAEERNRRLQELLNNRSQASAVDPVWQSDSSNTSRSLDLPGILIEPTESQIEDSIELKPVTPEDRSQNRSDGSSGSRSGSSPSRSRNQLPPEIQNESITPMPDANADGPSGLQIPRASQNPGGSNNSLLNPPGSPLRDRETRRNQSNPSARVSARPNRLIDVGELQPPSVDMGPSPLDSSDSKQITPPKIPSTIDSSELLDFQIGLPDELMVQPASATIRSSSQENRVAQILGSTKPVEQDRKVVEIGYHPVLCRGWNLNEIDGDDGVSIVLQPRNAAGECIDITGELTVVLVDPNQSGDAAKVGYHKIGADKVREATEAFGNSKGIHLTLPWQYGDPTGNQLLIAVRFVTEDGRQMKNTKTIPISLDGNRSAAWTPRTTR